MRGGHSRITSIHLYDFHLWKYQPFIVWELIPGNTLALLPIRTTLPLLKTLVHRPVLSRIGFVWRCHALPKKWPCTPNILISTTCWNNTLPPKCPTMRDSSLMFVVSPTSDPGDHEFTAGQFDDYPATAISTGKMCQYMCEPNVAKHFFALFGVFSCFYQLPYLLVGILFLQWV